MNSELKMDLISNTCSWKSVKYVIESDIEAENQAISSFCLLRLQTGSLLVPSATPRL